MRTEDGHIIQKCLDGDSAAFGLLVDKYKAGIYAFAYGKLRNFHDAQDVVNCSETSYTYLGIPMLENKRCHPTALYHNSRQTNKTRMLGV